MRDSFSPLPILFVLAIALSCGAFYIACQSDMKSNEMRNQCKDKGGVWYRDGKQGQCLDIKTIPLKEP